MTLTASTAALGALTASSAAGVAAGLLEEDGSLFFDEAANPVLDESGG